MRSLKIGGVKKRYKYYTDELCPHCDREVRIPARVKPIPNCPKCHKPCIPCSACDHEPKRCVDCEDGSKFKLHPGEKVKKTGFRLGTIIRIADKAYCNAHLDNQLGVVTLCHRHPDLDFGDTLAEFIAKELKDTYLPEFSREEAVRGALIAVTTARAQLESVEGAFRERLRKLQCQKKK